VQGVKVCEQMLVRHREAAAYKRLDCLAHKSRRAADGEAICRSASAQADVLHADVVLQTAGKTQKHTGRLHRLAIERAELLHYALYPWDVVALRDDERAQRLPLVLAEYPYTLAVGRAFAQIVADLYAASGLGIVRLHVEVVTPEIYIPSGALYVRPACLGPDHRRLP